MGIEPMHSGFADHGVSTSPRHQNLCNYHILAEYLASIKVNKSPPITGGLIFLTKNIYLTKAILGHIDFTTHG